MFSHFLRKVWPLAWAAPPGLTSARTAGRRWQMTEAGAAVFGAAGPDPDRWLATGAAAVVKANPFRTIYRAELPGGAVYVKHCRVRGVRAWAREVLRPPKARLEFENALELRARGVPTVEPLAWGRADSPWPGESYLITRARDGAVPFTEFVNRVLPGLADADRAAVRRQLARALGTFFATLHDAGVAHPDPHPGNLLVEVPPSRVPRLTLIDLHAVGLGRPLGWAASRANLVVFNRWFQLRATRTDRLRFWLAYRRARRSLPAAGPSAAAAQAGEVERATAASNLRFWAGRVSRCLGANRYFRRLKVGPYRGHAVRDLPGDVLADLLRDPDAAFARPGVTVLKDSRTSTVARFEIPTPAGPRAVVLKRVNVRRWAEPWKNLFRRSAVLRSWVAGHALRDRWVATPRPLAAFHRRRRGLPAEGYLLVEEVPRAAELTAAAAAAAVARLARLLRQMHDRAVGHRDLKAANVLLAGGSDPVLIDLVGVRVGRAVPFAERARQLARLNASFLNCPAVTRSVRLRFLRAYLAAGPRRPEGWRAWWAAVAGATAAKVAKNRRSGRPLA